MPLPVPLLPEVMLIQETLAAAHQPQPEEVVTLTEPVPPEELKASLVGLIEYVHA